MTSKPEEDEPVYAKLIAMALILLLFFLALPFAGWVMGNYCDWVYGFLP